MTNQGMYGGSAQSEMNWPSDRRFPVLVMTHVPDSNAVVLHILHFPVEMDLPGNFAGFDLGHLLEEADLPATVRNLATSGSLQVPALLISRHAAATDSCLCSETVLRRFIIPRDPSAPRGDASERARARSRRPDSDAVDGETCANDGEVKDCGADVGGGAG